MTDPSILGRVAEWHQNRSRWPLTRQITSIFTAVMLGNAILITLAIDLWSDRVLNQEIAALSQSSRITYAKLETSQVPTARELQALNADLAGVQTRLIEKTDAALYWMIGIAGIVTMAIGYWLIGRVGRGLSSVASAARQIASGDLTARAGPVSFASKEEIALISDFNDMSTALYRASRELAESTASIAHELRTPLTILQGRLHGIADGVFALKPDEIDGLLYQVEGLGRLVDDLQTVSLAHSQRLRLDVANTDLAIEVRRVLAATSPDLEAAGLSAQLDLQAAQLDCDGMRIRQLITAVLANTCRYAKGSGPVAITTRSAGSFVILAIKDCGPGLPDDAGDRAFDRFWRADGSRNRSSGGTGLGLSVVRAIALAHGGMVELRNGVPDGACFTLRLPITQPDRVRFNANTLPIG
ncbi:MAG: HAMP domain-containing histidine kinase [Sphingopyxis sp.]|nr:HAMP domain-containing histidine kinase [Sphingopyxis sp.]